MRCEKTFESYANWNSQWQWQRKKKEKKTKSKWKDNRQWQKRWDRENWQNCKLWQFEWEIVAVGPQSISTQEAMQAIKAFFYDFIIPSHFHRHGCTREPIYSRLPADMLIKWPKIRGNIYSVAILSLSTRDCTDTSKPISLQMTEIWMKWGWNNAATKTVHTTPTTRKLWTESKGKIHSNKSGHTNTK